MAREVINVVFLRPGEIRVLSQEDWLAHHMTGPSTRKVRDENAVPLCSERYNASTGSLWPSGPKWFDRLFFHLQSSTHSPGGIYSIKYLLKRYLFLINHLSLLALTMSICVKLLGNKVDSLKYGAKWNKYLLSIL